MGVHVAPGVYVREIDLSLYVPALSTTIVGMVGRSVKGPTNTRTFITSQQQFIDTFGEPNSSVGYEAYAALQYLRRGRQLHFVRVVGGDAAKASVALQMEEAITSETLDDTPDGSIQSFSGTLSNENCAPGSLDITATVDTAAVTILDNSNGVLYGSEAAVVDEVIDDTPNGVLTEFSGTLAYYPIDPGSLEITATITSAVTISDDGEGVLSGTSVTGTINYTTGEWTLAWSVGAPDDETDITADYTAIRDSAITNDVVGTIDYTTGDWTLVWTTDAPDDTSDILADYTDLKDCFTAEAVYEGEWGNRISVDIEDGSEEDTFKLTVYFDDYAVERFNNLDLDSTGSKYVETLINDVSEYITVSVEATVTDSDLPYNTPSAVALVDGDTDASGVTASDVVGVAWNEGLGQATGLQLFASPQAVDVNLLAAPGWSDSAVVTGLISICETRADCMAIIDPPDNLTPQEVVDWHNGQGDWVADHAAFNSSYAALYWPWIKIYDAYNGQYVFTPPSGHVLAVYAYTDQNGESWYAPAGVNRGRVISGVDSAYDPTLGEMELLYGDGNAINPIERFTQDGLVVWGQRTLQRTPTALDRVNVRRLLLYLRKVIATATRALVFEPNDSKTWRRFGHLVTPFLNDVVERRGLYDFRVKCDETTNTPEVIDRNEMKAQIFLKPVKAAEFIQVDLVITRTGANFDEVLY